MQKEFVRVAMMTGMIERRDDKERKRRWKKIYPILVSRKMTWMYVLGVLMEYDSWPSTIDSFIIIFIIVTCICLK